MRGIGVRFADGRFVRLAIARRRRGPRHEPSVSVACSLRLAVLIGVSSED